MINGGGLSKRKVVDKPLFIHGALLLTTWPADTRRIMSIYKVTVMFCSNPRFLLLYVLLSAG